MTDNITSGNASGTQWKSRFPVARIKKIMQADEDVGKVAQVTPVAISKALELFMDRIIKAVADETKARGARRVTPSHFRLEDVRTYEDQRRLKISYVPHSVFECSYQMVGLASMRNFSLSGLPRIVEGGYAYSFYRFKNLTNLPSKQIITTQKQYDFLESLTASIPLPPSRPSTPPPSQSRRRRKAASPSLEPPTPSDPAPPKRKRRSPTKETFNHGSDEPMDVKSEGEVKSEDRMDIEQNRSGDDRHRRGWFDIVMGESNEHESSDDEAFPKRKYSPLPNTSTLSPMCVIVLMYRKAAKDEDEDYIP